MSRGNMIPSGEFGTLFNELMTTRAQYEALRISGGPFGERAMMLGRLHTIRHDMDLIRRTLA